MSRRTAKRKSGAAVGRIMRHTEESKSWVVYQMMVHGKLVGGGAVCEQREWEAMQRIQPGHHTLIQANIANEGEAEALARRTSVDGNGGKPAAATLARRQKPAEILNVL
jgi:hypothetical protein